MRKASWDELRDVCGWPQRVCWAVAAHEDERSICPLGWKMNTSFSPPMMAISVAPKRFTHELIEKSGEVVIAWPGADLAEATLRTGTITGRGRDKFTDSGLTAVAGARVKAPLVAEAAANLEGVVRGRLTTGDHTIFAVEIVEVWFHENPKAIVCQIEHGEGYRVLAEKGRYRLGVAKT